MSEWLISIVGVILLGVLLEIVIPEGKTAKYVKGAFSLLVIFAIAAPLPALFKKDFTFSLDSGAIEIDETYVEDAYENYAQKLSLAIERFLEEEGVVVAHVDAQISDGRVERIILRGVGERGEEAKSKIAERLNIDIERIEICDF